MREKSRSSFHLRKSPTRIQALCRAVCLFVALFLFAQASSAFDFKDIMRSFATDFDRIDAKQMKGRLVSVIGAISGMTLRNNVTIVFKTRGDVKQESFKLDMKLQKTSDASSFSAYEYMLKQLHLLDSDIDLKALLYDSMYDHVYGFYQPETKNLVIMERASDRITAAVLLHELVHAFQDSTVNMKKFLDENCKSIDSCLASGALIEGQATTVELLIGIEQNLRDKTSKEVLQAVYEQIQSSESQEKERKVDFLTAVRQFPYAEGLKFVIGRNLEGQSFTAMFDQVPASSEQVLHPDKLATREKPMTTELSKKKAAFSRAHGARLVLDTSLGEYYIQALLGQSMKKDAESLKRVKSGAAGWGGDTMYVFQNGNGFFFIWDTLWDTSADADEFFQCYLDFSKARYNVESFPAETEPRVVYGTDKSAMDVQKDGTRVLIVEGELSDSQKELIRSILVQDQKG